MDFHDLYALTGGRFGKLDTTCPECSYFRRPKNQRQKVLRLWADDGFISFCCCHCGAKGWVRDGSRSVDRATIDRRKAESAKIEQEDIAERLRIALWLWDRAEPADGTIAETYLLSRGIHVLPSTIRFLPASDEHLPALIAPYGIPDEPEPGILEMPRENIRGVQLTKLKPDGSGKAPVEPNKISIGRSLGWPMVLAPMNDLLGLVIAEGLEDALSMHQAMGLGAWASGGCSRLPDLAERVPDYTDCIQLIVDADEDGRKFCRELYRRLRSRGLHVDPIDFSKEIAA